MSKSVTAGSYGKNMFSFVEIAKLSSKVYVPFCISATNVVDMLTAFAGVRVLNFGHSKRCVMVSSYSFNLHFPGHS